MKIDAAFTIKLLKEMQFKLTSGISKEKLSFSSPGFVEGLNSRLEGRIFSGDEILIPLTGDQKTTSWKKLTLKLVKFEVNSMLKTTAYRKNFAYFEHINVQWIVSSMVLIFPSKTM